MLLCLGYFGRDKGAEYLKTILLSLKRQDAFSPHRRTKQKSKFIAYTFLLFLEYLLLYFSCTFLSSLSAMCVKLSSFSDKFLEMSNYLGCFRYLSSSYPRQPHSRSLIRISNKAGNVTQSTLWIKPYLLQAVSKLDLQRGIISVLLFVKESTKRKHKRLTIGFSTVIHSSMANAILL